MSTESLPDLRDVACRLERVDVRYGAVCALREVTVELIDGEITCVVGMPGSGRSTLARLVAGIDDLTFGRAWADGVDVSRLRCAEAIARRARGAKLLGHGADLIPSLTIRDHLELSLALDGCAPRTSERLLRRALQRAGVTARASTPVRRLRPRDLERVALALAILTEPRIVVADDFGAGPDASDDERERDLDLLDALSAACRSFGGSAMVVSNDPEIAARADRIVALDEGRVSCDAYGTSAAAAARLVHELAAFSVLRG